MRRCRLHYLSKIDVSLIVYWLLAGRLSFRCNFATVRHQDVTFFCFVDVDIDVCVAINLLDYACFVFSEVILARFFFIAFDGRIDLLHSARCDMFLLEFIFNAIFLS